MSRRLLSAAIAAIALFVLSVPLLIVALIVKITSPGPALFRQTRIGKLGRPFAILKFRTMTAGASQQSAITVGRDARITRLGRFLRDTKIDELPQLMNVLKGDMNLVGPRPELPVFVQKYSAADRAIVLSLEPGMTDFASIRYRNESELLGAAEDPIALYEHVVLPRKLRYARFYARRASVAVDFYVIALTLRSLFADALGKTTAVPTGTRRKPCVRAPARPL
jgi:lipopolysaccharide/colanic/teichoic acid biosynthesis glycosyltransferase